MHGQDGRAVCMCSLTGAALSFIRILHSEISLDKLQVRPNLTSHVEL